MNSTTTEDACIPDAHNTATTPMANHKVKVSLINKQRQTLCVQQTCTLKLASKLRVACMASVEGEGKRKKTTARGKGLKNSRASFDPFRPLLRPVTQANLRTTKGRSAISQRKFKKGPSSRAECCERCVISCGS